MIPFFCQTLVELVYLIFIIFYNNFGDEPATFMATVVKSVPIRSHSGPHFPAFGLNTEYLSVFSPNAGKYGPDGHFSRSECDILY